MLRGDGHYAVNQRGSHRQLKHPPASRPQEVTAMRYAIVIEKTDANYGAYVLDLPGCVATGATIE